MSITQDFEDQMTLRAMARQQKTGRAVTVAFVLFAIAAGLVYYASQLWLQQRSTSEKLKATSTVLGDLRKENVARASQLATLQQTGKDQDAKLKVSDDKVLELTAQLAAAQSRLEELDAEHFEIKEQLAEFKQITQQFKRMIDSGRLQITFRKGRMIVELPAQVLFPSGSAELTDDGQKSLAEVAHILRVMRGRHFIVAGHTDNVPVATDHFANNWELSTARAVTVTGALVRGGLRPEQLVAAGYSEYDPIARNTSEAGRQKNRRIEIMLEPRLKPIPGLEDSTAKKPAAKTATKKTVTKPNTKKRAPKS
jgi:chemotaxis protein MotB